MQKYIRTTVLVNQTKSGNFTFENCRQRSILCSDYVNKTSDMYTLLSTGTFIL